MSKIFKVGPTKFGIAGILEFACYGDNHRTAIRVVDEVSGEPQYVATTNIDHAPSPNCVWLKTWSENEGVLDAFTTAGIGKATGHSEPTGFVKAIEFELSADVLARIAEIEKE